MSAGSALLVRVSTRELLVDAPDDQPSLTLDVHPAGTADDCSDCAWHTSLIYGFDDDGRAGLRLVVRGVVQQLTGGNPHEQCASGAHRRLRSRAQPIPSTLSRRELS